MVGTFGLLSDNHASHFPADRLVENRTRLDAFELDRIGALVEGATTEFRWGERRDQLSRQGANLLVDGIRISVIWTDWAVPWFLCPACSQRCKHLYLGELLYASSLPPCSRTRAAASSIARCSGLACAPGAHQLWPRHCR